MFVQDVGLAGLEIVFSSHAQHRSTFSALMENFLDKGHIVYTDRYYTSVPLADRLTVATGIV